MKFEKIWVEPIQKDLIDLTEEEFEELDNEFEKILTSPNSKTKRVKGWKHNIRRIRFGNYRLLIMVKEESLTVYSLMFLPRKDCYSKKTEKIIEKIVKQIN